MWRRTSPRFASGLRMTVRTCSSPTFRATMSPSMVATIVWLASRRPISSAAMSEVPTSPAEIEATRRGSEVRGRIWETITPSLRARAAPSTPGSLFRVPRASLILWSVAFGVSHPIPRGLSPSETAERIVADGGVAVAAHPYRFWSGLGERSTLSATFAAYEVRNARTSRAGNELAERLAARQNVGRTGGSDSHFLHEHGRAFTVLDAGPASLGTVLEALASGRTRAEGVDRGPKETAVYVTKCVSESILRGMRRI